MFSSAVFVCGVPGAPKWTQIEKCVLRLCSHLLTSLCGSSQFVPLSKCSSCFRLLGCGENCKFPSWDYCPVFSSPIILLRRQGCYSDWQVFGINGCVLTCDLRKQNFVRVWSDRVPSFFIANVFPNLSKDIKFKLACEHLSCQFTLVCVLFCRWCKMRSLFCVFMHPVAFVLRNSVVFFSWESPFSMYRHDLYHDTRLLGWYYAVLLKKTF